MSRLPLNIVNHLQKHLLHQILTSQVSKLDNRKIQEENEEKIYLTALISNAFTKHLAPSKTMSLFPNDNVFTV